MSSLQILHEVPGPALTLAPRWIERLEYILLGASFGDTAGYDIGYNVSWLDPGEKQLTDLAKAADGVQVCLS